MLRLELPLLDDERAQKMWAGTLTLRRGDEVVLRREVAIPFHGRVPEPLAFEVAVAPGRYAVEVAFFGDRRAIGDGLVPAAGATLRLLR